MAVIKQICAKKIYKLLALAGMIITLAAYDLTSANAANSSAHAAPSKEKAISGNEGEHSKAGARVSYKEILNNARSELEKLEKKLDTESLTQDNLIEMRNKASEASAKIRVVISELSPRAAALSAQLAQLGPKPAEEDPIESEATAREREDRRRNLAEIQAHINLAEALLVQSMQIITSINDHRRIAFAGEVFVHGHSLLSLKLWKEAVAGIPEALQTGHKLFGDWLAQAIQQGRDGLALAIFAMFVVGIGLFKLQQRFLPQLTHRDRAENNPGRLRRVMKALGVILCVAVPVAASIITLMAALYTEGLAEGRTEPVILLLLLIPASILVAIAFAKALLAPGLSAWRLIDLDDERALWLYRSSLILTTIYLLGELAQEVVATVDGNLSLVALVDGLSALSFALYLFWTLQGLRRRTRPIEDDFGPYVPAEPQLWGLLRTAAWVATLTTILATLAGFIAFASFIVNQILWVAIIVGAFFLLITLADEVAVELPKRHSRISLVLQTSVGLRRSTLEQIGILISGLLKIILIAMGALLILAPWGVESNDVFSSLKTMQHGFMIGEVRMSPIGIAGAVISFVVTLAISRVTQRWLSTRFLPVTGLDIGIRTSIATAAGYIGFFLATSIACAQLGLSMDKVAIVAGALSVGIGFGLQSIVNNFVSGLILLWERPIKVGDWVVVGTDEGYVKRINVRATEIETFDRASVIVPNSNLVSGTVKNWLHHDRLGRLIISVGVNYAADPEEVREIMLACAKNHPQVLNAPPPSVLLVGFEPTMLRFEMRCFIPNIEDRLSISSDLNFAVLRALREKDLVPVRPMVWEEWKFGRSGPPKEEGGYHHVTGQGAAESSSS